MRTGLAAAPVPPEFSVERGRDAYLAENGFSVETYTAKYTPASFLGIPLKVPNTKHHQWAIKLHDLHHVATGYGTDMAGEAEVSAWEARRGVRSLGLYVGSIVVSLALFGLVIAPRRTIAAWRVSGDSAHSLFGRGDLEYDALLRMSVAELRAELRVPAHGVPQLQRGLHALAPKI
jgi:hypothetical protein